MQTVFALLSRAVPSEQGHTGGSSNNKKSSVGLDNEAQAPLCQTDSSASSRYRRDVWALVRYLASDDVNATASVEAMKILLRLLCRCGPEDELFDGTLDHATSDAASGGLGRGAMASVSHSGIGVNIDNSTSGMSKSAVNPHPGIESAKSIRSRVLLALTSPPRRDIMPVHLFLSLLEKKRGGKHGIYAIACACAAVVASLREGSLPSSVPFNGSGTADIEDESIFYLLGLTAPGLSALFSSAIEKFIHLENGDLVDSNEMLHRIRISFTLLQLSMHGIFPPDDVMRDVQFVFDASSSRGEHVGGMGPSYDSSIAPERVSKEALSHRFYEAHFEGEGTVFTSSS